MVLRRSFEIHLEKLEKLMTSAAASENPALFLFENDARTLFFMLEALSRLGLEFYEKRSFEKLLGRFKSHEDLLGAIDYADEAAQELGKAENVPPAIVAHFAAEKKGKLAELNALLKEESWLDGQRIAKIRKKLGKNDWESAKRELKLLEKLYQKEVKALNEQFSGEINFSDVEADVHELRRDLRWLSIYPHAAAGALRLSNGSPKPTPEMRKYLTTEVMTSPFNKFPPPLENGEKPVPLDQHSFYALSWMIAELGQLKDEGLLHHALTEALKTVAKKKEAEAEKRSRELLKGRAPEEILQLAELIVRDYFAGGSIAKLVPGASKKKAA